MESAHAPRNDDAEQSDSPAQEVQCERVSASASHHHRERHGSELHVVPRDENADAARDLHRRGQLHVLSSLRREERDRSAGCDSSNPQNVRSERLSDAGRDHDRQRIVRRLHAVHAEGSAHAPRA